MSVDSEKNMFKLLIVVCLFSIISAGSSLIYFDELNYNPCNTQSGLYFYPHPTDIHKYYQCDERGNAYIRSCGDLVWDALRTACNWASAVIASSSSTTTISTLPIIITAITTSTEQTTTTTTTTTVIVTGTLPTIQPPPTAPLPSLCKPVHPCGEHGVCVESAATIPRSTRRFACICDDNWFGRLCDRQITELTTPATNFNDESRTIITPNETIHFPIQTENDSKLIFYGLKASKIMPNFNQTLQE